MIIRSYLVTLWALLFISCGPAVAQSVAVFDFEIVSHAVRSLWGMSGRRMVPLPFLPFIVGAGHGRMRDDELENDLRPADATDLRGPAGQRIALELSEQLAFAKR